MKTKHTKGEWKQLFSPLSREHTNYIICDNYETKRGFQIATIHINYDGKENEKRFQEAEANARLIAAAPDMLEALKSIMKNAPDSFHIPSWDKMLRAIAKAEQK